MPKPHRFVVVTGCSSGIGACLYQGLINKGYHVIASCRKNADVEVLKGKNLYGISLDLANSQSVEEAINQIQQLTGGRVYGLINNGAYGQPGAVIDLEREVLRQQFESNVFGTQQLTNGILPMMLPHGEGRVIQISSVLGFICLKYRGAYNASKFALEALTDTMRLEHHGSGIHFSLVEPGPIESMFRQNAYAAFKTNIDCENSLFRDVYKSVEKRLSQIETQRFTLPADAVLEVAVHALEAKRPKIRYPVTVPTRVMAILKRVLSDRWMDAFLLFNSDHKK